MFLSYHAKNQSHYQVSERTSSYFIKICKYQLTFPNGGKFEKLISIEICFYPTIPKISLIFRCPKGVIAILSKFTNMQKSADFCKWREIWKAHFNWNMFLPYHAKIQPHFQVSKRTYSHFIKIHKYAKISWFLQMAGNLKKLISIEICFYPTMVKITLIFRCPKGLIAILSKFANMQKSADFCKWREIWKAHIN